jgi:hypothetical protein
MALVPVAATNGRGGPTAFNVLVWKVLLWTDTKTSTRFGPELRKLGGSEQLRQNVDALSSTPRGAVAVLLDKAIGEAQAAPPPFPIGSYLPPDATAVWVPSLGICVLND